ncbi:MULTISPECIES: ABC transporter substrate-binding protein [Paenibacillus]|uniref:ABC transporter substrate-binding protein n=1 Tax=Paenibacillus TaxID=44249 RepID=UPI00073EED04|nr:MULTISPECIES: sugar ABC transporter substrate-binding protein [Paenibacillus]MDU2241849.1 sugar ABC transporter substrate-binding protein [Paenibacillus sp.]MDU4695781.1 sugar ABC transporter substrate-binding protein [Paenibacillus sp.]
MKKTKAMLLASLLLVTAILVSACGSGSNNAGKANTGNSSQPSEAGGAATEEQVELRVMWWGDQTRADITTAMLKKFEEKHPNIKVVPEFSPFDGYFDKLNTQLASGTAPDLFTLGSNILEYATRNVLLDINSYVGNEVDTSKISPQLINMNTFDGKLQGISIGANSTAILANTALFEKAGLPMPTKEWTWDDFIKINEQIAATGKDTYGSYDYSGEMDQFGVYLTQRDKMIYNEPEQKLGFEAADVAEWFTLWEGMRKAGSIVTPELQISADPDDTSMSLVTKGQVAMQFIPTNQFADFQKMSQDKLTLIPVPMGPNGSMISVQSSQNIVGYANTKHPKEVAMLMDFWVNDPDAAKILGNNRGVPVSSEMRAVLKAEASETDKVVYDYLDIVAVDDVDLLYNVPGSNEFKQELLKASQNVAFGRMDIAKAAEEFYAQGLKILQANLSATTN